MKESQENVLVTSFFWSRGRDAVIQNRASGTLALKYPKLHVDCSDFFVEDLLSCQPPVKDKPILPLVFESRFIHNQLRLRGQVASFNDGHSPTIASGVSWLYIIYSSKLQHVLPIIRRIWNYVHELLTFRSRVAHPLLRLGSLFLWLSWNRSPQTDISPHVPPPCVECSLV